MNKMVFSAVILSIPTLWADDLTGKVEASVFGADAHVTESYYRGAHSTYGGSVGFGIAARATAFDMSESATSVRVDEASVLSGLPDHELAEHIKRQLNLALSLACKREQERRCGHWADAQACEKRWEEAMADVRRLLPLLKARGFPLFEQKKETTGRHRTARF